MDQSLIRQQIRDLSMITVGNIVMALGYAKFMVPNQIINGGVTSLSQIVNHFFPISIPLANNLWLGFLLVLTLLFLGWENFLKSIVGSVVYSVSFTLFFAWPRQLAVTPLLDLVLASGMIAFGYYACLASNASTVGVDVFALIIHKFRPSVSLSRTIRYFNLSILLVGFLTFGFWSILYGLLFTFLYSHELAWLLRRFKVLPFG